MTTAADRVSEARATVVDDLRSEACYRQALAETYPHDTLKAQKNAPYAEPPRMAVDYVAAPPDDDPSLGALAAREATRPECRGHFGLPSGGDGVPSQSSAGAAVGGPRGRVVDPAELASRFAEWAAGAADEANDLRARQDAAAWKERGAAK